MHGTDAERLFQVEALPHIDVLFRTAVRLTTDRAEAEDLVQETYARDWLSFAAYAPGTNCLRVGRRVEDAVERRAAAPGRELLDEPVGIAVLGLTFEPGRRLPPLSEERKALPVEDVEPRREREGPARPVRSRLAFGA